MLVKPRLHVDAMLGSLPLIQGWRQEFPDTKAKVPERGAKV